MEEEKREEKGNALEYQSHVLTYIQSGVFLQFPYFQGGLNSMFT